MFFVGQLIIENVKKHDAGTYLCIASNGIGSEQTKVISVEVQGKTVDINCFCTVCSCKAKCTAEN